MLTWLPHCPKSCIPKLGNLAAISHTVSSRLLLDQFGGVCSKENVQQAFTREKGSDKTLWYITALCCICCIHQPPTKATAQNVVLRFRCQAMQGSSCSHSRGGERTSKGELGLGFRVTARITISVGTMITMSVAASRRKKQNRRSVPPKILDVRLQEPMYIVTRYTPSL